MVLDWKVKTNTNRARTPEDGRSSNQKHCEKPLPGPVPCRLSLPDCPLASSFFEIAY
jgi:hypothetical protein